MRSRRMRQPATLRALRTALMRQPRNHWLLTRIASEYYEKRQYRTALRYAKRAYAIAPKCPLVNWDLAGCLDMTGQKRKAIRMWTRLIERGPISLAYGECGEGIVWARALVMDSHYRKGSSFRDLGLAHEAVRELRRYVALKRRWRGGLYEIREANHQLRALRNPIGRAANP